MTAAVGRATQAPSGAPSAALYYEDEATLRRQRTVEHLGELGVRVTKIVHANNADSAGLAGIDLVLCLEDQLAPDIVQKILGRARASDLPGFAIRHPRAHASWRHLEKYLDPKTSSTPPPPLALLTAKLPIPASIAKLPLPPRIVPSPARSPVADSVAETEQLAAMYQAEADELKRALQERDDRIIHLEAELRTAKQQPGDVVVRERLATDLAAARADRTKALRDAEALTARLGAAERERAEIERALLDLQKSRAEPAPVAAPVAPSTWEVRARSLVNAWGVGALTADEALERIRRVE